MHFCMHKSKHKNRADFRTKKHSNRGHRQSMNNNNNNNNNNNHLSIWVFDTAVPEFNSTKAQIEQRILAGVYYTDCESIQRWGSEAILHHGRV